MDPDKYVYTTYEDFEKWSEERRLYHKANPLTEEESLLLRKKIRPVITKYGGKVTKLAIYVIPILKLVDYDIIETGLNMGYSEDDMKAALVCYNDMGPFDNL